jgi:phenylalanine-4-hydroxylase
MTAYHSKPADENGFIHYDDIENSTWAKLYERQSKIVAHRGAQEYLDGIEALHMPADRIPQLPEINKYLEKLTGWNVVQVPALIGYDKFFHLLANRQFPAATFIRTPEQMDYLQEPDIFHEIYGHCPMLTNSVYADFMQAYGKLGLNASEYEQRMLARVYWFTVEFGLIATDAGLRIYGGGILSSMGETPYALESPLPQRRHFNLMDALRTPYRIDIFQTVYFVINDYQELYDLMNADLFDAIKSAKELGEFPPTYPAKVAVKN